MSPESLVVFILILGVLVAFHEFGHFIAAKLSGMKVEEFAFGFGPRLVRLFKRRETEYTIHAVPLGGFVKITGMEPGEEDIPDGFGAKPIWKRALVIFSGPLFSFILAVIAFELIGIFWGFPNENKTLNKVLMVEPKSEAANIGLRAGDKILQINGQKVSNGRQMVDIIHGQPGKHIKLLIDREGRRSTLTATPRWSIAFLGTSWSFMNGNQAVAKNVAKESAAAKAGIKSDDVLAAFNEKPITSGKDLDAAIRANGARGATLTVVRKGETVTVHAKPALISVDFAGVTWYFPGAEAGDLNNQVGPIKLGDRLLRVNDHKISKGEQLLAAVRGTDKVSLELKRPRREKPLQLTVKTGKVESAMSQSIGLLGFMPQFEFTKLDYVDSLEAGWKGTKDLVGLIFASLAWHKIGESVGGPILIARQTSITVDLGPYYVVQLAGMLSLSLAIMNLFPIPIFDGGQLALLAIEAVRRRRLTREQMQWVQMAGLAIIGMLIITIFFSDISKWAGGKLPQ